MAGVYVDSEFELVSDSNGWRKHTHHRVGGRSVSNETVAMDLPLSQPEGVGVGALVGKAMSRQAEALKKPRA